MSSKEKSLLSLDLLGPGCYYLQAPSLGFKMLCGCPPDAIKLLRAKGFVKLTTLEGRETETGPNAILLSDKRIQGGEISNLTEFPVLQILYKQGYAIPGHPNHRAKKPIILGKRRPLISQAEYLKRGNYGLVNLEEYQGLGISVEDAKMHLDLKEQLAYGPFLETADLLELIRFDGPQVELRGLSLTRIADNCFVARLGESSVEFSLNLPEGESYQTSYHLEPKKIEWPRFGVLHLGDGDGWDTSRPCLNSLVIAEKQKILIDSGPFVMQNLQILGVDPGQLSGICFTHVHDDHFAGFFHLLRHDPGLKIWATPRVFASLVKKYCALIGLKESTLRKRLNFEPLKPEKWNSLGSVTVKPIPSAHPIDTTLLLFRKRLGNRYKTYGHLSDIMGLAQLHQLVENCGYPKAARRLEKKLIDVYQMRLDLKKVDIGGGSIHGAAEDFAQDPSAELLLSHTSSPLSPGQYSFGTQPGFGEVHCLIP